MLFVYLLLVFSFLKDAANYVCCQISFHLLQRHIAFVFRLRTETESMHIILIDNLYDLTYYDPYRLSKVLFKSPILDD